MARTVQSDQQLEQALDALAETEGPRSRMSSGVPSSNAASGPGIPVESTPLRGGSPSAGRCARAPRYGVGDVEYLELEDVLYLVRHLGIGSVRDVGPVDSAVASPRSGPFGEDASRSP